MKRLALLLLSLVFSGSVLGWENHAQMTSVMLDAWARDDAKIKPYLHQTVKAESLDTFLKATKDTLPVRLEAIEKWLVQNETGYRPVPQSLYYEPTSPKCSEDLATCFKQAIRINLDVPTPCVIYRGRSPLDTVLEGTYVRRMDVISAGVLQPDLGMDTFLYENSPSTFGKIYGFGTQPVGSPTIPIQSQILFHMSTYSEDQIVLTFMPRFKEDYPEARVYLYFNLSQFAKETGHDYWSAIFLGWGLHYIQDMTQPFHSALSLGLSKPMQLYLLMQAAFGNRKPMDDFQMIQSNRHFLLEKLTAWILESTDPGIETWQLASSLNDYETDKIIPGCDISQLFIRREMQKRMDKISPQYVTMLLKIMPSYLVDDPEYDIDKFSDYNDLFTSKMSRSGRYRFVSSIKQVLNLFGAYTRQCILTSNTNQS